MRVDGATRVEQKEVACVCRVYLVYYRQIKVFLFKRVGVSCIYKAYSMGTAYGSSQV